MNITIYTIYKITNNINNKIYIGKHSTTNPNDSYFGSGNLIKQSITKYGKENFTKEILFEFNNEEDAYLKENEIVNQSFIDRTDTYNLCLGGIGSQMGCVQSEESKSKRTNSLKLYYKNNSSKNIGRIETLEHKKKRIESLPKGKEHHLFNGYFHTNTGIYYTTKDASLNTSPLDRHTISKHCKNPDKIILQQSINGSTYLKSLKESPLGKTWRDLGFWFEPIKL